MSEFGPTWKSEVVPCQQIDGFFASEANIFSLRMRIIGCGSASMSM